MNCCICHKPLTDPESVERGMGPVCAGRQGRGLSFPADEHAEDQWLNDPPFNEAFVFERRYLPDAMGGLERTVTYTNVPHLTCWHSPTGYEWGYLGSGPADTALDIVEATLHYLGHHGPRTRTWKQHTCFALAGVLHQDFKEQFVARIPRNGGRIPFADVVAWIRERQLDPEVLARLTWYAEFEG